MKFGTFGPSKLMAPSVPPKNNLTYLITFTLLTFYRPGALPVKALIQHKILLKSVKISALYIIVVVYCWSHMHTVVMAAFQVNMSQPDS